MQLQISLKRLYQILIEFYNFDLQISLNTITLHYIMLSLKLINVQLIDMSTKHETEYNTMQEFQNINI